MKNRHPYLALGNLVEGVVGILAIASIGYSLLLYGLTIPLLFSFSYTVAVAVIAIMSAYHLGLA